MNATLAGSALLLGLAGSPHCAVMCGALQATAVRRLGGSSLRSAIGLQAGRLLGYAAGGALVAASASAIASITAASAALRPFWALWHVAAVVFGLVLLSSGRVPAWLSSWWTPAPAAAAGAGAGWSKVTWLSALPAPAKSIGVGACWLALPCGLLQSALIVASLASGPGEGAAVMAAFGTGTFASLAWLAWPWRARGVTAHADRWAALSIRAAGGLLVAGSGWALFHLLESRWTQAICV